ncbi:MAG: hypothetical protein ACR5KV_03145 [Wolbachia sp.]
MKRDLKIYKAYKNLNAYIKSLKSGNPCIKISVDTESGGRLTKKKEFYYRRKLFNRLKISEEETIGKNFVENLS